MTECKKKCQDGKGFYGTTTLGERGQVVIPAKAREDFKLEKGEQLLVFGMHENIITLVKVQQAHKFVEDLSVKLKSMKSVLKKIT